jgi:hypothetical protein
LRLLPPFIIGKKQVKEFLAKIETVFARTKRSAEAGAAAAGAPTARPKALVASR